MESRKNMILTAEGSLIFSSSENVKLLRAEIRQRNIFWCVVQRDVVA